MKINYHQNPLRSSVELTEVDIQVMKLRIKMEELYNNIFNAYYKVESINEIKLSLGNIINSDDNPESDINKRTEQLLGYYVYDLTLGCSHSGDCTKVCCSCTKCQAETFAGIDTTDGIKCFHYIDEAYPNNDTTIDEAIKNLSTPTVYNPELNNWHTPENIARWNKEKSLALESLIAYKEKHFPESSGETNE